MRDFITNHLFVKFFFIFVTAHLKRAFNVHFWTSKAASDHRGSERRWMRLFRTWGMEEPSRHSTWGSRSSDSIQRIKKSISIYEKGLGTILDKHLQSGNHNNTFPFPGPAWSPARAFSKLTTASTIKQTAGIKAQHVYYKMATTYILRSLSDYHECTLPTYYSCLKEKSNSTVTPTEIFIMIIF